MLFFLSTQSKSIKKTKFGACLFGPIGKEMGGEGELRGWGWAEQLFQDLGPPWEWGRLALDCREKGEQQWGTENKEGDLWGG